MTPTPSPAKQEAIPVEKHTPGPWSTDKISGDLTILGSPAWPCKWFGEKGRWGIAVLDDTITDDYPKEAKANARLICSAPDLLHACKALITAHDANDVPAGEIAVELMRAAIAKATGK